MYDLEELPVLHQSRYVNIYRGTDEVAIKEFRVAQGGVEADLLIAMVQMLHQQQSQINLLQHDHISPISVADARVAGMAVPAIACSWYKNGNILEYLRRNPDADKLSLIIDIAYGLAGLHSVGVIHGNLHPGNLLVMDNGKICITDVGILSSIIQTTQGQVPIPKSWPFKSPEELRHRINTQQTDVYSFACNVFSTYTGKYPIRCSPYPAARGILQIMDTGHRDLLDSLKPKELDGTLWAILRRCWSVNPANRPTMTTVQAELRELFHHLRFQNDPT